ncbi:MAG: TrmH family RNA methyltransferase, partial [Desulfocucumaceae bacterium]
VQVDDRLISELTSTETPQGVLALCVMKSPLLGDILGGSRGLAVIADGVSDPGNLGTIIRSADAFGADGVILTMGSVDLYNSKVLRSTMGSVFHLPILNDTAPAGLFECLQKGGLRLLVGVPAGGSPVSRLDLRGPLALVVGSEAKGPSRELLSLPHQRVTIPMPGGSESLNAAVAASILLYEVARQREGCYV